MSTIDGPLKTINMVLHIQPLYASSPLNMNLLTYNKRRKNTKPTTVETMNAFRNSGQPVK